MNIVRHPIMMQLSDVQQVAVDKAIKLLKAAGVQYAIRYPDGATTGDLKIAPPEAVPPARRKFNNFRKYGYIAKVDAMQPGDTITIVVPEDVREAGAKAIDSFQGSIASRAAKSFGPGNFITTATGEGRTAIEILRVA